MAVTPSPLSTGHAGPTYEQYLGASCVAILLTGGMMPFSSDKALTKVHLQTRHLGWATDDLLLAGEARNGIEHRVAIQAKRTFVLQASDEECVKTLRAAWTDFTNGLLFREEFDRIALVTGETPTSFSRGMRAVLDAARASLNIADFGTRASKYFSRDAHHCFQVLCEILRNYAGAAASEEAVWQFLRIWDFVVLDFQVPSGSAETLIKSLLSATATGPFVQANDIWNALLSLVGKEMSRARSFDWNALPLELREGHRIPFSAQRETFASLRLASSIVRDGVDGRLANSVALPRSQVVAEGLAMLDEMEALLLSGPAGSGKSVIASKIHDVVARDTLAVTFRADTLATPHLATSALNVGLNLQSLVRLFTLHNRKFLWIESAERLFEKSRAEREAFMDLIRLLAREGGWKLLVTCREHSAERFRSAFLEGAGLRSAVLTMPDLSNDELDVVVSEFPQLRAPLGEPTLREVLRNPFNLNLATRMLWPSDRCAAMGRRAFREKAWREVICRDDEPASGMHLERDTAMIEVALRRARALVPYVSVDGISAAAVHLLERDSLLAANPGNGSHFTPKHDVYEDWALLQYLIRVRERVEGVNARFFTELGPHPALRRAFRLWLLELLDAEQLEGEQLVLSMMNDATLSGYWRDEALVAVFQCTGAFQVIQRLAHALLVGDGTALRRAVHLLRVSCRKLPQGVVATARAAPFLLVPDGSAWEVMPRILVQATPLLKTTDIPWLLGFLEDWAKGARQSSKPQGAEEALALCELLISCTKHINDRYRRTFRERVLKVMLSIPAAAEQQIRTAVDQALAEERGDPDDRIILKFIWSHFKGATTCRDLPDVTLRVAESKLRLVQENQPRGKGRARSPAHRRVQGAFGLGHLPDTYDFPPSAWQGPFLNLLTYHPERGIEFVLKLLNKCCEEYSAVGDDSVEPPFETEIVFNDGSRHRQWANGRLWGLYRGNSGGPDVLQSALMALEAWLLQKGERGDKDFREVFSKLLRESNNVAITAVLVSVALAYPYLLTETAVPLLSNPDFFDADLARSTQDQIDSQSAISQMWPQTDEEELLMEGERAETGKKRHRRENLESLAVMLQMTTARPLVWKLIDRYRAKLPPTVEQTDADRVWRLRLHRVDIRNFAPAGETEDGNVLYQAGPPAPELEEFKQRDLPIHQDLDRRARLYLWGVNVFEWRDTEKFQPEEWREKLAAVRTLPPVTETDLPRLLYTSGVPQIAAVCLRDHWTELTDDERSWCAESVCRELESLPNLGVFTAGMIGAGEGVNAAAQTASLVIARTDHQQLRARAMSGLAAALLHSERHIAQAAANGIGAAFFELDRKTVLASVHSLLAWARETAVFNSKERSLPWNERRQGDAFDRELRERLCAEWEYAVFEENSVFAADYLRSPGLYVLLPILGIFGRAHTDPLAQRIHIHLATVLLNAWRSDRERHSYPRNEAAEAVELRFQERHHLTQSLSRFALSCSEETSLAIVEPLAAEACMHQENGADFIKQLAICEDQRPSGPRFWLLWQIFADAVIASSAEESDFQIRDLVGALFLGISWKPETCEWKPLAGESGRLLDFFQRLPPRHSTLTSFSILAARFREELIPTALPALAEKLACVPDPISLSQAAMGALESILESLIYTGASNIRSEPKLRAAALALLDTLVESGSSAAFTLRDDFLTPLRS